ncbi:hypothetical protein L218DRAFT_1077760 [Marasmius fiardii PR-910]|nr:hypothetical protein L218DRAFT_1077760 [Marasmius fiardii PR-910]
MMSKFLQLKNLPVCVLLLLQVSLAWGQASQAPPTSFGGETSITGSVTGTAITDSATTTGVSTTNSSASGSMTSSSSATPTRSADLPDLSKYSPCVSGALQLAVSDMNCSTVAQPACYCPNSTFPNALIQRIRTQGCPNELSTAEGLVQQFCAVASTSVSFSITSFPSSSANSTTSAGNNGAYSLFNPEATLGLVVALAGMMLGAFYV